MSGSFTGWLDRVGGNVSKAVERETGEVTLTFFTDAEEAMLEQMYADRATPRDAALAIVHDRKEKGT